MNISLTNLCSCALIKDHQMKQIINNIYLLSIRIMNLALRKNICTLFFFKNLRLYPLSPPPSMTYVTYFNVKL